MATNAYWCTAMTYDGNTEHKVYATESAAMQHFTTVLKGNHRSHNVAVVVMKKDYGGWQPVTEGRPKGCSHKDLLAAEGTSRKTPDMHLSKQDAKARNLATKQAKKQAAKGAVTSDAQQYDGLREYIRQTVPNPSSEDIKNTNTDIKEVTISYNLVMSTETNSAGTYEENITTGYTHSAEINSKYEGEIFSKSGSVLAAFTAEAHTKHNLTISTEFGFNWNETKTVMKKFEMKDGATQYVYQVVMQARTRDNQYLSWKGAVVCTDKEMPLRTTQTFDPK